MNKRKANRKIALGGWSHYSKKNKEYFKNKEQLKMRMLNSTIASFKIEGITFTEKQILDS